MPGHGWIIPTCDAKYAALRPTQNLNAVPPRVRRVETPHSGYVICPLDRRAHLRETARERLQAFRWNNERRMRLPSRRERFLRADMELLRANLEPHAAARFQALGLLNFRQSKQPTEEASGFALAAPRCCKLNMVKLDFGHGDRLPADHFTPCFGVDA